MDQNENVTGVTPEDIMKEITAEEVSVTEEVSEVTSEAVAEATEEVVEEVAESVVEEPVEEIPAEEVAETVVEEASEEVVEETVAETPAEEPYFEEGSYTEETPAERTYQDSYVYGDYNQANEYIYDPNQVGTEGEGLCVAALVLGIVSIFLNPCYITSILAIVFGIIGQTKNNSKKSMAMWGWILGIVAIVLHIFADTLFSLFSGGLGFFSFCC